MRCFENHSGSKYWIKRAIFIPIAIAAAVFIFGSAVMLLWNWILPAVIGISTITFWQAIGILVLARILFGSFKGHSHHAKYHYSMHRKHINWMKMSPEERAKIKEEWKHRCTPKEETEKE